MHSRRSHLAYALGTLVMGAALVLISSVDAQATDTIEDPVRQPHLKSWSNVIPNAAKRFVVLADFNNEAVLDRETGLVWETSLATRVYDWSQARLACLNRSVGGRKGWRLPSIPELASLTDPSTSNPSLPTGHPFLNVPPVNASVWSATLRDTNYIWFMQLDFANVNETTQASQFSAWCVRGGMNADRY